MIFVSRKPRPTVLVRNAKRWQVALRAATTKKEKKDILNKYKNASIKRSLVEMFNGKCAYCESTISHVDYGHIEHYRPKSGPSGRPDLVFAWSNLLLACGVCNGSENKGERFPDGRSGGPIINCCKDRPEIHFDFVYDPITRLASVYGKTVRGKTTENLLGLNRPELRRFRSRQIQKLVLLSFIARTDANAALLIAEAKQSDSDYSAFAIALL